MFEFGFSVKDFVRSAWTFGIVYVVAFTAGALGIVRTLLDTCNKGNCDVPAAKSALIALALSTAAAVVTALKNLVLKDGTNVKG